MTLVQECIVAGLMIMVRFNFVKLDDPCQSEIFCRGEMYEAIQQAITEDFVNKKLLVDPEIALLLFKNLTREHAKEALIQRESTINATNSTEYDDEVESSNDISEKIETFVAEYFEDETDGVDYEVWKLPDKNIKNISKNINDRNLASFVDYVTNMLPTLALKGTNDTLEHRNRYSIRSASGFIKRHREAKEAFYWETYWVVNGFLLCEMYETAKVTLDNLISMVVQFGYIPKGNRIYYSKRSNPPFLTLMAYNYFLKSKNYDWLKQNVKHLDEELRFWITNRSVTIEKDGRSHTMFRYIVNCSSPRPEAFKEDVKLAKQAKDEQEFYKEIHSASESGWDFSSRWLLDDDGNVSNELTDLSVTRIIPVDLNAYLYKNFVYIARIYNILANNNKRAFWQRKSQLLQDAINHVLWDDQDGIWYDYDIELGHNRKFYFISNFMPLWSSAFPLEMASKYGEYVARYMNKHKLITKYRGCLPDTFAETTQHYDFPSSHSHLVVMVIQGLRDTQHKDATRKANILLKNWMDAVISCWEDTKVLFDTYSAEYFGHHMAYHEWNEDYSITAGVILDVLDIQNVMVERILTSSACGIEWNLATFVNHITNLLPQLALKGTNETLEHMNRHSISSANGFIRRHKEAKEAFYWETYWVVNGFILCEMYETVEVILDNLISMVMEFGFVPKGNRLYHSQRSNPPFLTLMAYNYFLRSKNYDWLKRNVEHLDAELMFWVTNRSVTIEKDGRRHYMFRYIVDCSSPRPEAFKKDEGLAEGAKEKRKFYKEIHSASESGWDFSSRWLLDEEGNVSSDLTDINVTRVIPVDLNAYLFKNFVHLAQIYNIIANNEAHAFWKRKSQDLQNAIHYVLWDDQEGIWYDYDIEMNRHRKQYFISNFMPLWASAFPLDVASKYGEYVTRYMRKHEIATKYRGCLPDSFVETTESYDYPNSHSHLVVMVIQGLKATRNVGAIRLADVLLTNWMDAVISCWAETKCLFDTYSAAQFGQHVSYQEWSEDHSVTAGAFLDTLDTYHFATETLYSTANLSESCVLTFLIYFILIIY